MGSPQHTCQFVRHSLLWVKIIDFKQLHFGQLSAIAKGDNETNEGKD